MNFTEHVKIREEKFGSVIFETLKEKIFITNNAGKDILNLLQKGHSQEEVADILSNTYSNEDGYLKNDVINFIEQLKENNIIK